MESEDGSWTSANGGELSAPRYQARLGAWHRYVSLSCLRTAKNFYSFNNLVNLISSGARVV